MGFLIRVIRVNPWLIHLESQYYPKSHLAAVHLLVSSRKHLCNLWIKRIQKELEFHVQVEILFCCKQDVAAGCQYHSASRPDGTRRADRDSFLRNLSLGSARGARRVE